METTTNEKSEENVEESTTMAKGDNHQQQKAVKEEEKVKAQQQMCPICVEDFVQGEYHSSFRFLVGHLRRQLLVLLGCLCSSSSSPRRCLLQQQAITVPCCQERICLQCCYRQIQACFEGGMTGQSNNNGRSIIACPHCRQEWNDAHIRRILSEYQYATSITSALWNVLGQIVMFVLIFIGYFSPQLQDPFQSSRYYKSWYYWYHSAAILQDLEKYEQWSLTVALRSAATTTNTIVVVHCPAPDCTYQWIVADSTQYRRKQVQEEKAWTLWYTPPKPERLPFDWVEPQYLNFHNLTLEQKTEIQESMENNNNSHNQDGRQMTCAKCRTVFCGLCRQPWHLSNTKSHTKIACSSYAKKLPRSNDDNADFNFVAAMADCRSCPKCSIRTHRIDGCNHMTCPCGMEWCYVCECKWNPIHYSCVDHRNRNNNNNHDICHIM